MTSSSATVAPQWCRRRDRIGAAAVFIAIAAVCAVGPASADAGAVQPVPPASSTELQREPIRPLPISVSLNPRKVALGRSLFSDPALSRDGTVSCASCHALDSGGTDHRQHSMGLHRTEGAVNAPTVFNVGFNFRQFWDGRAETLEAQIDGPLQSPGEMGSDWRDVLPRLRGLKDYAAGFAQTYSDGISADNVRNAIAEFERSLITPNARFDRFLRGDSAALTDEEKAGYLKFKSYGCISCHQGVNVGGNMFQRMGVIGDYFADRGNVTQADYGRFNVTKDEADRYTFKVPSLRNVELTAPYFHDGSAQTLDEAVAIMAKYQLGRQLPPQDRDQLVKFLKTLTGVYGGQAP